MNQLSHLSKLNRSRASRRGNLLIVSVVFVMIIASMGMVMLQMHTSQSRRQLTSTDNKRALYIAEAGLAEAFVCIAQGKSGNVGTEAIPAQYADGIYWVEATPGNNDEISLVSTGLCGTGRFAISIVLERNVDPIAKLGFFANTDVTVGEGAILDGYDSTLGTLASQIDGALPGETTGANALVSAGTDIILEGTADDGGGAKVVGVGGAEPATPGTMLYGDARPGPQGVVSQAANVTITGSTIPLHQATSLPDIVSPEVGEAVAWPFPTSGGTVIAGEYRTTSAVVSGRGVLRIEGPAVLVFSDLRIQTGGKLQIDSTNGQVVIFVEDYLKLADGSVVENVTADPTGFALFASGTEFIDRDEDTIPDPPLEFGATGEFYGYLYAPATDLVLSADVHFIGGVAANSLALAEGGHLTFDVALINSEIAAAGLPTLIAWRIVALPEADIVKIRKDPIMKLSDAGITPVKSADASEDAYVSIKYRDLGGVAQGYAGLYSGFDWSNVDSVIAIMWDDDAVIGDEGQEWSAPSTLTDSRVVREADAIRLTK